MNPRNFDRPGMAEYVLARAGLVEVTKNAGDIQVTPAPAMKALFKPDAQPSMDVVLPAMTTMVLAMAIEKSGFVDATSMRIQAQEVLRGQGIAEAGLVSFVRNMTQAAEDVRQQRSSETSVKAM